MLEIIQQVILYVAPTLTGVISSIVIPLLIKRFSIRSLQKKIDEVTPSEEMKKIETELTNIKKEILEMRGKRK